MDDTKFIKALVQELKSTKQELKKAQSLMGKLEQALKMEKSKRNNRANSVKTLETVASTASKAAVLAAGLDILQRKKE